MLRRKQGPGAENVFQELYGQVLQVMVTVKILKIRYIENPNLDKNSWCGCICHLILATRRVLYEKFDKIIL